MESEKMNKQYLITICLVLMIGSLLISPVLAVKPTITYDSTLKYTRHVGELGGAPYEILMPDNWNGHLVIGCKGYTTTTTPIPTMESLNSHVIGLQFMTDSKLVTPGGRFAYAQSTYGVIGFCMQEGMIHTHQLTQYVVDNFGVSGQIYLIGLSMGGQIANMLVDKYPTLYAGVLDICGNKDTTAFYNYWKGLSEQPNVAAIRTYLADKPASLPTAYVYDSIKLPDSALLKMQAGALVVMADVEAECGGSPDTKPQAYDRISPTCHPNIPVPTLSIVARADLLVPIQHFNDYYDAVKAGGCLSNYRSYTILGAQHCDASKIIPQVPTYFMQLFSWVNGAIPAPTPKPLP
jgi:hypothetical protein